MGLYSFPQFKGPEEEKGYLNKWVIENLKTGVFGGRWRKQPG
jgi:hypothetical protein